MGTKQRQEGGSTFWGGPRGCRACGSGRRAAGGPGRGRRCTAGAAVLALQNNNNNNNENGQCPNWISVLFSSFPPTSVTDRWKRRRSTTAGARRSKKKWKEKKKGRTGGGDEGRVVAEGHERFGQLAQVGLDGAGDGLVLPLEPILQAEPVGFPPVQAHRQQLVHLGRHAHQPVQALVLQSYTPPPPPSTSSSLEVVERNSFFCRLWFSFPVTSVFDFFDAGADEVEAGVVQGRLLVFGRFAARLRVRLRPWTDKNRTWPRNARQNPFSTATKTRTFTQSSSVNRPRNEWI